MKRARIAAWTAALGAVSLAGAAIAQPAPTLPAMKFVTAPLVAPATAESFYGSGLTHTNSLAGVSGFGATSPEIVETARALKSAAFPSGDPDLIFEYVHNQIDTEFAFGERKGPVGTLIDRSGTPFDQSALFVALVRQAGLSAQYQIGTVSIAAADFANWTGVSDLGAACRMLSSGGIAAAFTPAAPSGCQTSGAFTSVTILHVWSQVNIAGTWYNYDPSFKVYAGPAPVNLATASGLVAGQAAASAASGMDSGSQSGAAYVHNASEPTLDSYLQARGTQLLGWLKTNAAGLDTDTVVGLTKIQPLYKPAGGWRNTTAPGAAWLTVAGDMPDQFRTRLTVTMTANLNGFNPTTLFTWPFFVDDIDGRRIGIDTNFDNAHGINPSTYYTTQTESLVVDDVVVQSSSCAVNTSTCNIGEPGQITLTATHPYAAGTFADETVIKALTTITAPVAIVSGWGNISPARLTKWSDEVAQDKALPAGGTIPYRCEEDSAWCVEEYLQSAGDLTRQKLAASWLSQMTRMLALQAQIGGATAQHHHSIGVVDWRAQLQGNEFPPPPTPRQNYYGITDEFTDLNIDSVVSVTSKSNNLPAVAAISRSVAVASATLEGSVLEQMEDLPDTASTASRFAWGNQPDNEDPCFTTKNPRRFYDYTGTSGATRGGLYLYEGLNYPATQPSCSAHPLIIDSNGAPTAIVAQAESAISQYLAAGFHVTASAEVFLGPGARFGPAHVAGITPYNDPSQQRGAAIIATQWDGSGDVLQVAHVLTDLSGISKGGGGKQPQSFTEYDPAKAADALKDRFVDRSVVLGVDLKTGAAGYTTPTLLSIGAGSTPYKLDYALSFKAAPNGCSAIFGPCTGPIAGGWNQTWDVRFSTSGSGTEAMSATSPYAAAGTLAAFLAMQDIFAQSGLADLNKDVFGALASDWWRQQMVGNVATINRGFSGAQYVRQADATWMPPIGSPGVLTQIGLRVKVRDHCQPVVSQANPYSTSRRWDHSAVTFSLRGAGGDVLTVSPWSWNYETDNHCAIVYGYQPVAWTWPQGPSLAFTYDDQQGVTAITTSLGRSMTFTGGPAAAGQLLTATAGGLTAGQTGTGSGIVDAAGNETWNFALTSVTARAVSQRPIPYPELYQVFEPVSTTYPALQYGYDSRGLVKTALDATALQWGTRGAYAWFLALGGRGERDDPAGGAYAVYYDTDGDAVRNIDEIGREVDSVWDGRHRVVSRTYPETDQDQFAYDANDNVTSLTKLAKTGSGLANLTVTATYEPTWNHLASIVDPMGNETDFSYYASGAGASLMQQAQRPAVGGTRPTFTYQYNAIGLPTQSVDPTGVTTTHAYDGYGNLTSTTEAAAAVGSNPALNLTTVFTPDAVGNVTAVTDPLGNAVTTQYDAMRRKLDEQNRNGGVTALPLMAKQFIHDLNGRLTTENRATGFDGSGNPTGWQAWLTAYTPTGKTAVATDPLGNATYTGYDALDRVSQVTDASGRVTARTYDLAGQELTELRGVGTPLAQTYATFTYGLDGEKASVRDANGNTINLAYDGFNRLSTITHPDATTETSQYDPDGDLTIWTNRGGFSIVRCYDVLNRKVSETGTTGASNTGACPTGGSANLATRWWDTQPRTFTYDLASRLTGAAVPGMAYSWAYDAAGRPTGRGGNWPMDYVWDAAGNMTAIGYTSGRRYQYAYDALNRTTAATGNGVTLATLAYDPLGRRTTLSFGDSSSQTWGYDNADRVTSLAHAFPNTPDNVTLSYGYDNAGREITRSTSNSAYAYSPPTASSAYAAANALNQYPSVNSYPYTWWPQGGLNQTDQLQANYDEAGNGPWMGALKHSARRSTAPCGSQA